MIVGTTWRARPLSPEQTNRMMDTWGKLEASFAEKGGAERLCWYVTVDGSAGVTINRVKDIEAASAWSLEASIALGEFLELDSRILLDMDAALPALQRAIERKNA